MVLTTLVHDYVVVKVNEDSETTIMFFNENGQQVFTGKARGQQQFDISKLASGIYI